MTHGQRHEGEHSTGCPDHVQRLHGDGQREVARSAPINQLKGPGRERRTVGVMGRPQRPTLRTAGADGEAEPHRAAISWRACAPDREIRDAMFVAKQLHGSGFSSPHAPFLRRLEIIVTCEVKPAVHEIESEFG